MSGLFTMILAGLLATAEQPAEKPTWIDRPAHLQGTVYQTTVKSGLFVTKAECEQAIEPKLREAVAHYLEEYLTPRAAAQLSVDASLLDKLQKDHYLETVQSATVGPMRQLQVLLEFDDAARAELAGRWHRAVVNVRLRGLAVGCGTVLGLLGVAVGYLKLDLRTAGQRRGRLKLLAVAAILMVFATAAIVRRSLLS